MVMDMFPYPSGSGLHAGHPLGYIATDVFARYLRMTGHNVLHPFGYDAFGLPAEQYAIDSGQHPKGIGGWALAMTYDLGYLSTSEPFRRLLNQGYILADIYSASGALLDDIGRAKSDSTRDRNQHGDQFVHCTLTPRPPPANRRTT